MANLFDSIASACLAGLPTTVALACVAAIGYVWGRGGWGSSGGDDATRRERKLARAAIQELQRIAEEIRRSLATHHGDIGAFKRRLSDLANSRAESTGNEAVQALAMEAERILAPTERLATEIAQAYDGLRRQSARLSTIAPSRVDPTTGVANPRALDETLRSMLDMHSRYGAVFSVAVFDVDPRRQDAAIANEPGEDVAKRLAGVLDESTRETDVVARVGDEEFVAVLPGADLVGARRFAERLRANVSRRVGVTVSGGVTMVRPGDTPKTILGRADSALYASKAAGRDIVHEHDGDRTEPVPRTALTAAIDAFKSTDVSRLRPRSMTSGA